MQFKTKLGLVDIPNADVLAAAREIQRGVSASKPAEVIVAEAFYRQRKALDEILTLASSNADRSEIATVAHRGLTADAS